MHTTIEHEIIKNWIMKWGGVPAIGIESLDRDGKGILRVNFGKEHSGEPIGWDEFFDIFEADRLAFRYADSVDKGNEELYFNFVNRAKQPSSTDDETALPEDNAIALENMYNNFEEDQLS